MAAKMTATEIDIKQIDPPVGGKFKQYDPDQIDHGIFFDGVQREGILNPISVRPTGDGRYELVCGQKRLWAARRMKWAKIQAVVGEWTPEETQFVRIIENLHRKQMSKAEKAKAVKDLIAEFAKLYGQDPGNALGGKARSEKAERRGQSGEFQKTPDPSASTQVPALAAAANAGAPITPDQATAEQPKTYRQRVAEVSGQSERVSRNDVTIAEAFNNEQLEMLGMRNIGERDLLKMARIVDAEQRNRVVNLVCSNVAVDEAIKREKAIPKLKRTDAPKPPKDADLSDMDWARLYCSTLLKEVAEPDRLLNAISLYRKVVPALTDLKKAIGGKVQQTRTLGYDPLSYLLGRTISVSHPSQWYLCGLCKGANGGHKQCLDCKGTGFRLRHDQGQLG